jgi:uncharacterized protein YebE (UPF0316 family)
MGRGGRSLELLRLVRGSARRMTGMEFLDTAPFWLLALVVFLARMSDVTLGTMRMIAVVHGRAPTAVVLGFFEILIWITAVSGVIVKLNQYPLLVVAYAAGFAAGNAVGIGLERRLAMGSCVITLVSKAGAEVAAAMRAVGQRVTVLDGEGRDGPRQVVYATARRRDMKSLIQAAKSIDPGVFYVVQLCSETSHVAGLAFIGRLRGGAKHKCGQPPAKATAPIVYPQPYRRCSKIGTDVIP